MRKKILIGLVSLLFISNLTVYAGSQTNNINKNTSINDSNDNYPYYTNIIKTEICLDDSDIEKLGITPTTDGFNWAIVHIDAWYSPLPSKISDYDLPYVKDGVSYKSYLVLNIGDGYTTESNHWRKDKIWTIYPDRDPYLSEHTINFPSDFDICHMCGDGIRGWGYFIDRALEIKIEVTSSIPETTLDDNIASCIVSDGVGIEGYVTKKEGLFGEKIPQESALVYCLSDHPYDFGYYWYSVADGEGYYYIPAPYIENEPYLDFRTVIINDDGDRVFNNKTLNNLNPLELYNLDFTYRLTLNNDKQIINSLFAQLFGKLPLFARLLPIFARLL